MLDFTAKQKLVVIGNGMAGMRTLENLLDRAPDASGLSYWEGQAVEGVPLQTIAQDFLTSAEYTGQHANDSNTQFIDTLYQNALGRATDAYGLADYSNQLSGGASRASVALQIVQSYEAQLHLSGVVEAGLKLN